MPSKQILINDLSLMNITKIGKKYGVSDSAVRKWLKKYNLPSKCNKITSFLKENNYEDKRYRKK